MIEEMITRLEEKSIEKSPTGINGLDEVTSSGLPKFRPAIVIGVQALKTLIAMEFLVKGAQKYNEPGVTDSLRTL